MQIGIEKVAGECDTRIQSEGQQLADSLDTFEFNEFFVYECAKTQLTSRGKEPIKISVYITDEMWKIIRKYGNQTTDPENFIFPILKPGMTALEEYEAKSIPYIVIL